MNNGMYAIFTWTAKLFNFTTAVAGCSALSAPASVVFVYFFAAGAKVPITYELVTWFSFWAGIAFVGHGAQFGVFTRLGIPAFSQDHRFLNQRISTKGSETMLSQDLSLDELKSALRVLVTLPRRNSQAAAFWVSLIIISIFVFMLRYELPSEQRMILILTSLMAIFMHGAFSFVVAELAVSRTVSKCREAIMAHEPSYISPVSSSLITKFGLLATLVLVALVDIFVVMRLSPLAPLSQIAVALIFNMLIVVILGYLILYRIISSLREIQQAARTLREGANTLVFSKAMDTEFVDIFEGLNSAALSIKDHQLHLESRIIDRTKELSLERDKSDKLLLNILPAAIAEELKQTGAAKPVRFDSVTVIFTDFVGFTKIAEHLKPDELIGELDRCFSYFDSVTEKYKLEKLKTIGDAFMCAGGIPNPNKTHVIDSALAALEIQGFMNQMKAIKEKQGFPYWELRLGMNTGELIAGVIGEKKFAYDVWGDTVNTASRMESSGMAGHINISKTTYEELKYLFNCEYRGKIKAKNKGEIDMYYLLGIKPKYSVNGEGRVPSAKFLEYYRAISEGRRLGYRSVKTK